mmetsp:Transcript_17648/g.25777  ORF Transcript_17648/g.25777 Transcript_17648/m.25777 type:complete len:242 (-) Transcript_17648:152-877(-)
MLLPLSLRGPIILRLFIGSMQLHHRQFIGLLLPFRFHVNVTIRVLMLHFRMAPHWMFCKIPRSPYNIPVLQMDIPIPGVGNHPVVKRISRKLFMDILPEVPLPPGGQAVAPLPVLPLFLQHHHAAVHEALSRDGVEVWHDNPPDEGPLVVRNVELGAAPHAPAHQARSVLHDTQVLFWAELPLLLPVQVIVPAMLREHYFVPLIHRDLAIVHVFHRGVGISVQSLHELEDIISRKLQNFFI